MIILFEWLKDELIDALTGEKVSSKVYVSTVHGAIGPSILI